MLHVGLLSDTHGYLDEPILKHLEKCDEIWHAGDVGTVHILDQLERIKPVRVVFGNIDGRDVRLRCPEHQRFDLEGVRIWMTHIGGAPPRYNPQVRPELQRQTPDLFICGHSHILRVMRDPALGKMLYVNPGAAGHHGFHHVRTLLRFGLDAGKVVNMEVVELGRRGAMG